LGAAVYDDALERRPDHIFVQQGRIALRIEQVGLVLRLGLAQLGSQFLHIRLRLGEVGLGGVMVLRQALQLPALG
jgi:hypothetical protein